ncbi:elongation of very long chain fatty acids protein AAEL008004 isoform X4 [Drosophila santomea]|uniref:elongation of very long chain fatty acids protein AAEL008004 isoform X4 n=1 Tax=Drosophila santomea TaxID=129105 RepID=UPI00195424BD|nr:elongation of very long chain fatty acids protein AAEL008004 isoform X4 [Drosophila santomea]
MALIMKYIDSISRYMDSHSDSRTKGWPMMSSPFPTLAVCLTYVYLVKVLGPRLMENRKPLNLQNTLVMYNAIQVVFSAWLFYEMVHACWWYYFSKFTEFMDTIFFVLRKKSSQVTTLHVIHHGCMPMSVWFGVKFTPGGHSTFFGLLNTFVHIVMYTYYMFSAMGPQYQKYLWWKKYLTTLQMVQFILIMVHAFQLLFIDCNYPKAFVWWIGMHAVMFFFLFNEFYKAAYRSRMMKRNGALANGHAKPNGYCKSINAHDDLAMPNHATTEATATPVSKTSGSSTSLSNGHSNGVDNVYKQVANGSAHKGSNGGLTNGYATKLLDDASQELKQRKTPK